jgi:excinuclease UvrABC helicase subunit UvrB
MDQPIGKYNRAKNLKEYLLEGLMIFLAVMLGFIAENIREDLAQNQKEKAKYEEMNERDLSKEIKRLEKEMVDFARNLEFEKAASTRDRLSKVRAMAFGAAAPDHPTI